MLKAAVFLILFFVLAFLSAWTQETRRPVLTLKYDGGASSEEEEESGELEASSYRHTMTATAVLTTGAKAIDKAISEALRKAVTPTPEKQLVQIVSNPCIVKIFWG